MEKVFLSHSSNDKFSYVQFIAQNLGRDVAVYDAVSFEAGQKIFSEIIKGITDSKLFVFFISDTSLDKEWVRKELDEAKALFDSSKIEFLPIISDEKILFDDSRIPAWISSKFNLRYQTKKNALRSIQKKLAEITICYHPNVALKDIFRCRQKDLTFFEERFYSTSLKKPLCCIASGLPRIGKKYFLKKCLKQYDIIKSSAHIFPTIVLESDYGLDEFIKFSEDLEISNYIPPEDLSSYSEQDKIQFLVNIYSDLNNKNDIILIEDRACIIQKSGILSSWFFGFVKKIYQKMNSILFIISSTSSLHNSLSYREYFFIRNLQPFSREESSILLNSYLEANNVELLPEDIRTALNWTSGYPMQFVYLADISKDCNSNFNEIKKYSHEIMRYGEKFATLTLKKYHDNLEATELLSLLANEVGIKKDYLYETLQYSNSKIKLLDEFQTYSICISTGSLGEFILLEDSLRQAIIRLRYKQNEDDKNNLLLKIKENFGNSEKQDIYSTTSYIEKSLLEDFNFSSTDILPFHFILAIRKLYNFRRYAEAIELCKRLRNHITSDNEKLYNILNQFEILSKIRTNIDVEDILKFIKEPNLSFFKGFREKQKGNFYKALSFYENAYKINNKYSIARNEFINLKVKLGEGYEVLDLAKDAYFSQPTNIFTVDIYFKCLLEKYLIKNSSEVEENLKNLIDELPDVTDIKHQEIRANIISKYLFYVKNEYGEALETLNKCLENESNIYLNLSKLAILYKLKRFDEANITLQLCEKNKNLDKYQLSLFVIAKGEFIALTNSYEAAEHYVSKNLRGYPDSTKRNYLRKIYEKSKRIT